MRLSFAETHFGEKTPRIFSPFKKLPFPYRKGATGAETEHAGFTPPE
jgi:hypothetical protein